MTDERKRIGVVLPIAQEEGDGRLAPYATLRPIAIAVEEAGFDSVWVFDHLVAAKKPRMLELAARHADAWNLAWFGLPDDRLARVRAELAAACARVGRDPSSLTDTVGVTIRYAADPGADASPGPALIGTPDEIAAGLRAHADAGADHFIASLEPCTERTVAEFAEAVARFRAG